MAMALHMGLSGSLACWSWPPLGPPPSEEGQSQLSLAGHWGQLFHKVVRGGASSPVCWPGEGEGSFPRLQGPWSQFSYSLDTEASSPRRG